MIWWDLCAGSEKHGAGRKQHYQRSKISEESGLRIALLVSTPQLKAGRQVMKDASYALCFEDDAPGRRTSVHVPQSSVGWPPTEWPKPPGSAHARPKSLCIRNWSNLHRSPCQKRLHRLTGSSLSPYHLRRNDCGWNPCRRDGSKQVYECPGPRSYQPLLHCIRVNLGRLNHVGALPLQTKL